MDNKILNITNGECFNEYYISKFGGLSVPFCEVMMDGETRANIYSQQFKEFEKAKKKRKFL